MKKGNNFSRLIMSIFCAFYHAIWTLPCGPIQTMQRNTRRARSSRRALNYLLYAAARSETVTTISHMT